VNSCSQVGHFDAAKTSDDYSARKRRATSPAWVWSYSKFCDTVPLQTMSLPSKLQVWIKSRILVSFIRYGAAQFPGGALSECQNTVQSSHHNLCKTESRMQRRRNMMWCASDVIVILRYVTCKYLFYSSHYHWQAIGARQWQARRSELKCEPTPWIEAT